MTGDAALKSKQSFKLLRLVGGSETSASDEVCIVPVNACDIYVVMWNWHGPSVWEVFKNMSASDRESSPHQCVGYYSEIQRCDGEWQPPIIIHISV